MIEEFHLEEDSRYLSEEQKWGIIISIKYFHLTYQQVADKFNIASKGTISKVNQKFLIQKNVENNNNFKGRRTKMDEETVECIEQVIEDFQGKKYSSKDVAKQLESDHKIQICYQTVIKCLKSLGYKYGRIKYIHQLSNTNKDDRNSIAKNLQTLNFDRIVFSDESLFQLSENGLQIWHPDESQLFKQSKELSYQHRQVMVWGFITTQGKGELYIHNSTVDSLEYIKCLE